MHIKRKTPLSWLFKMAWRDAKASKGRLFLFMLAIVLGISAVVSIQLFVKKESAFQATALPSMFFFIQLQNMQAVML